MTLEDVLLKEARKARERLIDLEYEADRARASYQHSIRRLHAAGGSLREIAEALDLSHQRVHQIVEAVAGKVAFKEESDGLLHCSFCGLSQKEVSKLIAGPGVCICDLCVDLATTVTAEGRAKPGGSMRLTPIDDSKKSCTFCGKRRPKLEEMAEARSHPSGRQKGGKTEETVRICNECLDLCNEILS